MAISTADLLDPAHTALVLQEVQQGVVGPNAALPALEAAAADVGLVENCARLATAARAVDVPVFHCIAQHRTDGLGGNRNARLFAGVKKSAVKLTPGTSAVAPPPEVGVDERDVVLARYHGLGPMSGTQLDPMLRNLEVRTIVAVGVSVNLGITNLCFDAVNRGYQVVLVTDAVAGFPADYARDVIEHTLTLITTPVATDDVVARWRVR